jgi:hypothetical protein
MSTTPSAVQVVSPARDLLVGWLVRSRWPGCSRRNDARPLARPRLGAGMRPFSSRPRRRPRWAGGSQRQPFGDRVGVQDVIAGGGQDASDQLQNCRFVFNYQNSRSVHATLRIPLQCGSLHGHSGSCSPGENRPPFSSAAECCRENMTICFRVTLALVQARAILALTAENEISSSGAMSLVDEPKHIISTMLGSRRVNVLVLGKLGSPVATARFIILQLRLR